MPRINVLPKNIADLIAAGEVVERPSSVIKEFVENSIDAGATNITVEIKNGGKTYIRVTDNGCGIDREDVKKAFISHATTKITNVEDRDAISTLGFRGEALASVCAVSRVELLTATPDFDLGTRYVI
jgi:DNA mismatch repair protein MutL